MTFLIRDIAVAKSGREIIRPKDVHSDELVIGRDPSCDITLADLKVELRHLSLTAAPGGMVTASALGDLPFALDGNSVTASTIDPSDESTIIIGPARLKITRNDDGRILITKRPVEEKEAKKDAMAAFALSSVMPSKRGMAWVFAVLVLGLLLTVPIVTNVFSTPPENDPYDKEVVGATQFDAAWSAGALSYEHAHLEDNCEACHVTPFVSVQDSTCLTCHEELGLGDHSDNPKMLKAGMPPLSTGDSIQWSIGEALGKEGPLGCVSCHAEHEGVVKLEEVDALWSQAFCSDCHDDLEARMKEAKEKDPELRAIDLGNAHDFGEDGGHPEFRPLVYTAHFSNEPVRVAQLNGPKEESGLKFTHYDHMDPDGGVAKMAISLDQYGEPLECDSCHKKWTEKEREQLGEGGMSNAAIDALGGFNWSEIDLKAMKQGGLSAGRIRDLGDYKPVVMEDSCEACHSLVFDRDGPNFRILSHGDVDTLMAELATMDRGPRQAVVTGRGRPGQFAPGGRYFSNFGRPMSAYISINRALESTGVCGECHIPTTLEGRRDLTPVNLPTRFLMHGGFNHAEHIEDEQGNVLECNECHMREEPGLGKSNVIGSNVATDLLIPDLASCKDCHAGEAAVDTPEITPSNCAMCHGFHVPTAPSRRDPHQNLPGNGGSGSVAAILSSLRR